ncbi:SpoIIE family protein phosphatase [Thiovibrio sp. JS02]
MKNAGAQIILIVDDSDVNRALLRNTLGKSYLLDEAVDGEIALHKAREILPDLILLDIRMPKLDGFEVCTRLKADPNTKNIPIIFITALDEPQNLKKGFEMGAVDYITKPFSHAEVLARAKTHLDLAASRKSVEVQNALLRKTVLDQELNIELARKILNFINSKTPRAVALTPEANLCVHVVSAPCKAEGGDHYFVKSIPAIAPSPRNKTIVSLKDQSGHSVNCVLRSIVTDLTNNLLLNGSLSLEEVVERLNDTICQAQVFKEDHFFTGILAEIEHETLRMRFISAGHPPFLLIRAGEISPWPPAPEGGGNLPVGVMAGARFEPAELQLRMGDKLLLYTDGLTDLPVRNQQQPLALPDLISHVRGILKEQPAITVTELVEVLLKNVADEAGEELIPFLRNTSADDITVIGLEVEDIRACRSKELVPADFASIDEMIDAFMAELRPALAEHGYEHREFQIQTAASEAILNAWKHGHRKKQDLPLTVRWRFGNDLTVEVLDRGDGFDLRTLPDPTARRNITAETGRGIFIIRECAQHVAWRDAGRQIQMIFNHLPLNQLEHGNESGKMVSMLEQLGHVPFSPKT